jgi:hypothetical protein
MLFATTAADVYQATMAVMISGREEGALPDGVVTFLMTDVVDSTQL